jgi:hypothetical protein
MLSDDGNVSGNYNDSLSFLRGCLPGVGDTKPNQQVLTQAPVNPASTDGSRHTARPGAELAENNHPS